MRMMTRIIISVWSSGLLFRFDQTGICVIQFAATISYVHENTMLVVLPNSNSLLDIQGCPDLGVQLYFDGTSYKTMFAA